jgi:cellulose biosynthesis protein BcsQ
MNEQLNDIVDSLWEHIMGVMQGDGGEICADYLRITCQKCLFAQERLKSLAENVADYKKKLDRGEILNSLYLAMDYDHLLISLRSSLEYLAKLINAAISQSLPNRLVLYQEIANLRNTVSELKESTELSAYSSLYKLSWYLKEKINQAWYKELMEP